MNMIQTIYIISLEKNNMASTYKSFKMNEHVYNIIFFYTQRKKK